MSFRQLIAASASYCTAHRDEREAFDRDPAGAVLGAGVLLFISFGIAYALPVFFPIVSKILTISKWHLTALFSGTGALYFSLGIISSPIADRVGARSVAAVGQIVLAGGLILTSRVRSELEFDIACFFGIGVGVGLCFVPAVGAVQALCQRNPTLAGGVAASGIGAGTLVMPWFARVTIDHLGWRAALEAMSVLALCGTLAALPLAKPRRPSRDRRRPAFSGRARLFSEPLQTDRFALLYTGQLMFSLVAFVPFAHFVC